MLTLYLARQLDSWDHMRIHLVRLQAISLYLHQRWCKPISILRGTTGSYKRGFMARLFTLWRLLKMSCDSISSIRITEHFFTEEKQRTALKAFIDAFTLSWLASGQFNELIWLAEVRHDRWFIQSPARGFLESACPFLNYLCGCLPRWFCVRNHLVCQLLSTDISIKWKTFSDPVKNHFGLFK